VYVRGFLRSYADFLGVDEQILLKLYEKEKGIKKNLEKDKKADPARTKPVNISSFVFTPQKILILAAAVLLFSGLFFLYKEIDSFASAPSLLILNPASDSEISGNSIYIEGITDKDASLYINGQSILVNDEGRFGENLTLQSGLNTINVRAINKFNKEAMRSVTVKSVSSESANQVPGTEGDKPSEGKNIPVDRKIKIDLRVDPGPVWLSVEADGNLVFSGTMLTGAIQTFSAKDKILVSSGKGNATFVTFNGKDAGVLSNEPGAVRDVAFTKDSSF
jgi:cytoskeletal protein RodZ